MNTHILIPIKDIEELLAHARANVKEFGQDWLRAADAYSFIKVSGKQISLDEKDIEEKATEYAFGVNSKNSSMVGAYKQALKDLL